jgi:hypothetical protein
MDELSPESGGLLHSFEPDRLLDTRDPASWPFGKLQTDDIMWLFLNFPSANQHIKAWVVNVTPPIRVPMGT